MEDCQHINYCPHLAELSETNNPGYAKQLRICRNREVHECNFDTYLTLIKKPLEARME